MSENCNLCIELYCAVLKPEKQFTSFNKIGGITKMMYLVCKKLQKPWETSKEDMTQTILYGPGKSVIWF